ncbi:unnamed protein product [Thlaspi arvense]|uniref:Uncharacterized protein n=1 Tax=Thlaspi arvense TaxID=13288 RepID=A0AAU9SDV9_THLAR|nr:unnamed protein product [Thlaspi arvense]
MTIQRKSSVLDNFGDVFDQCGFRFPQIGGGSVLTITLSLGELIAQLLCRQLQVVCLVESETASVLGEAVSILSMRFEDCFRRMLMAIKMRTPIYFELWHKRDGLRSGKAFDCCFFIRFRLEKKKSEAKPGSAGANKKETPMVHSRSVERNKETIQEIMMRGSSIMLGYLKVNNLAGRSFSSREVLMYVEKVRKKSFGVNDGSEDSEY